MPITRTYQCPECNHRMEVSLSAEQWDATPPSCEACDAHEMRQEFRPVAIGGSIAARAAAITENILANDYQVANFQPNNREGGVAKVRYKDETPGLTPGAWAAAQQTLQQAIDVGRAQRHTRYEKGPSGSGLDVLKAALSSGEQPDLIESSKRRAIKVWSVLGMLLICVASRGHL
jgi:hypothetical protein